MSTAQLYEELGRLRQQVETKDDQIRRLLNEQRILNLANEDVHRELAQCKDKLRRAEVEKERLVRDLHRLNDQVYGQETAITKLNEQVSKQQKTIKVQSDQIAAPKETPKPTPAPQNFGPPPQRYGNVYGQQHPTYQPPPSQQPSSYQHQAPGYPPPPPIPRQESRHPSVPPPSDFSNFGPHHGMMVSQRTDVSTINLLQEFTPFFNTVEGWAHNFVNVPDRVRDSAIPNGLRNTLQQTTNPAIALRLMTSSDTRYLTVAKLMNYGITSFAFRPVLLRGFKAYFDNKVSDFRAQLSIGIPLHVRRALLVACAQTILEMSQAPGFERWLDGQVERKAAEMWQMLDPLFAPGVVRDEAWKELRRIWGEAARIGVMMFSKASSYGMDYPTVGPNSYFNPSHMVTRDPDFPQNPQVLCQMRVTIRMAITPIVSETDFLASSVMPKTLHYSNVLLQD